MEMKKTVILLALAVGLTTQSCQQKTGTSTEALPTESVDTVPAANVTACDVHLGSLTFTHALNGADTCVTVKKDSTLEFRCTEKRDIFCDPNGQLTNSTLPILLSAIDNTKPFTLTAKVTPGFTEEGVYNAAALFVYANDTLWQKLCYEQDERGQHRIVTVRTQGTSDDNNHQQLAVPAVYLKLSSDTRTLASYYSLDRKEWRMVRLYKNYYPNRLWVGVASQCPQAGNCTSFFEDVRLEQTAVSDFRMGD